MNWRTVRYMHGHKSSPLINVRYLYQPGEFEGGTKRATDPIWSLKVYTLEGALTNNEPVSYYLSDGRKTALYAKNFWLCLQIHSFHLLILNIFVPVCQCVHSVVISKALYQRATVKPYSHTCRISRSPCCEECLYVQDKAVGVCEN